MNNESLSIKRSTLATLLAVALLAVPLTGCLGGNGDASEDTHAKIMAKATEVAEALDTPEEAEAAGYVPDRFCIPGMGVHWTHKPGQEGSYFDTELDPDHPEVLLFLPDTGNTSDTAGDKFLGIEYVVVTEGTEHNSTDNPLKLYGQPLAGPMPGHAPGMPYHAELHVYLAEDIRSGADFPETQDGIVCPEGTTPPQGA